MDYRSGSHGIVPALVYTNIICIKYNSTDTIGRLNSVLKIPYWIVYACMY